MSDIRIYELCADSDLVTEFVKYDDHAAIVAQLETDKENAEYCFRELKKINEQLEAFDDWCQGRELNMHWTTLAIVLKRLIAAAPEYKESEG